MKLFKYENNKQKLAPLRVFAGRIAKHVVVACCVSAVALVIGIAGYHWVAGLDWVDSLLEASMILGGMGPVNPIKTPGAKVFASAYALFSGLVLIGVMGIVLGPVAHRLMHKFHVE
jgi:hypothetical protein